MRKKSKLFNCRTKDGEEWEEWKFGGVVKIIRLIFSIVMRRSW